MRRFIVCVVLVAAALGSAALPLPWPIGPVFRGGESVATVTISNAAWEAKVGADATDVGLAATGGTITVPTGGDAENALVLRDIGNGEIGFASTGNHTTTNVVLAIASDATIATYLGSDGAACRVRHSVHFGKGTSDGTVSAPYTATPWLAAGSIPRMSMQYGVDGSDWQGIYLNIRASSVGAGGLDRQLRWGVPHLIDIYIERVSATSYKILWVVDGYVWAYTEGVSLANTRAQFKLAWNSNIYSGGTRHWLHWLGSEIETYASGGLGNFERIDQTSGSERYALPATDPETSVVTLHNAAGQVTAQDLSTGVGNAAYDSVWDWSGMTGGTLNCNDSPVDYNVTILGCRAYTIASPAGTAQTVVHTIPRLDGRTTLRIPVFQLGDHGYDIWVRDAAGNASVGVRIPSGSGDQLLTLLRPPSGFVSENTGIVINKARAYIIDLSFVDGKRLGIEAFCITNSASPRHQWYTSSWYTGLPPSTGIVSIDFSASGATACVFMGPTWGIQPIQLESSYTSSPGSTVIVATRVSGEARRAYEGDLGIGPGINDGYGARTNPAGPFCFRGYSGQSLDGLITQLGGNVSGWVKATAATPKHIVDGKVNDEDIPIYETLLFVDAMLSEGVPFLLGTTPAPAVYNTYTEEKRAVHLAGNQWMRAQDLVGRFGAGNFEDMVTYLGGEDAATVACGLTTGIHPDNADVYSEAFYASRSSAAGAAHRNTRITRDTRDTR